MTQRLENTLGPQQQTFSALLEKIKTYCKQHAERGKNHAQRWFYRYAVDVSSGGMYYTTAYGLQELAVGKDPETIVKTRMLGMLVHAAIMRPVGMLRNYVARRMGVTQDSSLLEKMKVNALATVPIQAIAYAGMLVGGMALSDTYDWKSSAAAWGIGMALSIPHSFFYGPIQDNYRRFYGIQPAIKRTQETTLEDSVQQEQ